MLKSISIHVKNQAYNQSTKKLNILTTTSTEAEGLEKHIFIQITGQAKTFYHLRERESFVDFCV